MAVLCGQAERLYPVLYGATAAEQREFLAAAVSLARLLVMRVLVAGAGARLHTPAAHDRGPGLHLSGGDVHHNMKIVQIIHLGVRMVMSGSPGRGWRGFLLPLQLHRLPRQLVLLPPPARTGQGGADLSRSQLSRDETVTSTAILLFFLNKYFGGSDR